MDKIKLEKAIAIIFKGDSPLEKWLDEPKNDIKIELYLFGLIYGWLFISDNDVVQLNIENIQYYHLKFIEALEKDGLQITDDFLFDLFLDRMEKYKEELSLIRESQTFPTVYFPNYFYNRVYLYPMKFNDINLIGQFKIDEWESDQLTDMFIHQINHLQNKFAQNL